MSKRVMARVFDVGFKYLKGPLIWEFRELGLRA